MIRPYINAHFIWNALRAGIAPWKFFQLNASYFNDDKGYFSKLDIEQHIPDCWSLKSMALKLPNMDIEHMRIQILEKYSYPFFLKPEWGQNGYGVFRVRDDRECREALEIIKKTQLPYFVQEAGKDVCEFEIFYVRCPKSDHEAAVFSVAESRSYTGESLPVHSVHYGTRYHDMTDEFSYVEIKKVLEHILSIGEFRMARVGVKAESKEALVRGDFQVIEINIFTPMPLNLLDLSQPWKVKKMFVWELSHALVQAIAALPDNDPKPIFWKKTKMHFKVKKLSPFLSSQQGS